MKIKKIDDSEEEGKVEAKIKKRLLIAAEEKKKKTKNVVQMAVHREQ